MKKLLLTVVLALCLTACGGQETTQPETTQPQTTQTEAETTQSADTAQPGYSPPLLPRICRAMG